MLIPTSTPKINQFYLSNNSRKIYQIVNLYPEDKLLDYLTYTAATGQPHQPTSTHETYTRFYRGIRRGCTPEEIQRLQPLSEINLLIALAQPTTLYALQYHNGQQWLTDAHTTDLAAHLPLFQQLKDHSPMRHQPWRIATYHFAQASAFDPPSAFNPPPGTEASLQACPGGDKRSVTIALSSAPFTPPRVLPDFIPAVYPWAPLLSYKPGDEEYNR